MVWGWVPAVVQNTVPGYSIIMSHTIRDKEKLLHRVRRIRGQLEAVERGLTDETDCYALLQTVAAARGALNGLMAQIIEGHIRLHVLDPDVPATSDQREAAEQLVDVIKSYLR